MAIVEKTKKAMIRAMSGVKLKEVFNSWNCLVLKTLWTEFPKQTEYDGMSRVLRRNSDEMLRALDYELIGRKRRGRPKMKWRQVVEKIGLKKIRHTEVVQCCKQTFRDHKVYPAISVNVDQIGFKTVDLSQYKVKGQVFILSRTCYVN